MFQSIITFNEVGVVFIGRTFNYLVFKTINAMTLM